MIILNLKARGGDVLHIKTFYNLTDDILFKNIFSHKKLVIDLLNSIFSYLKQDKKVIDVRISKDKSLYGVNRDVKLNYGDIIAYLDTNEIVSIEMYKLCEASHNLYYEKKKIMRSYDLNP